MTEDINQENENEIIINKASMARKKEHIKTVANYDNRAYDTYPNVLDYLNSSVNFIAAYSQHHCILSLNKCMSPIEMLMMIALYTINKTFCSKHEISLVIQPQFRISDYVVDFAFMIEITSPLKYTDPSTPADYRNVIIECDGHDWHDRDKEQRKYENSRDRYLLSEGWTVCHYTGSEIYNSPMTCAIDALNVAIPHTHIEEKRSLKKYKELMIR